MTVTLAKTSDAKVNELVSSGTIVNSVTLSESFKIKGQGSFSIRLETWRTTPGSNNTEVRIVIRDDNTGQFHGATNFKQNILLDMTNLMSGNHSNVRKSRNKK